MGRVLYWEITSLCTKSVFWRIIILKWPMEILRLLFPQEDYTKPKDGIRLYAVRQKYLLSHVWTSLKHKQPNTFFRNKETMPLHLRTVSSEYSPVCKNWEMDSFHKKWTHFQKTFFGQDFPIFPLSTHSTCNTNAGFSSEKKYQHAEGIWKSSKLLVDWKDWFVKKLQQSGDIAISMYMV